MTRLFRADEIERHVDDATALAAMREGLAAEAAGRVSLPKRIDSRTGRGFLRVMPAVLEDVMGFKAMTLVEGVGTRYVVLLFEVATGALLAILDADELTRIRTAATTAVAALAMVRRPPRRVGVIGSGFEAEAQVRAVARLWPAAELVVYSPTEERRVRFARDMSVALARTVTAAPTMAAAVAGSEVLVLATKAKEPVIDGTLVQRGAVVLSIGSTRPDLRELDRATFARAGTVVGDDPAQLESESGDIIEALGTGAFDRARMVSLAAVIAATAPLRTDADRDLLVLKTVGTALQDLALARAVYRRSQEIGFGEDIGEVARLKPFAAQRPAPARV